jgi:peptidoglycan/LPS O-acetylase OafA/YrhL/lysophospholipase L1-like esterase
MGTTRDAGTKSARDTGLPYMPALDGLRAVAVVAVLLYHGGVDWARGGYFGVDAFFVLSGFLITGLLLAEWRGARHIDLRAFWTRRARRLLPAVLLVLAAIAVYATAIAQPVELGSLRRDAFATLGYVANWNQIFSDQSYFAQYAAPSPLRHVWSLAIEEQFYLVWPLVVLLVLRIGHGSRRHLFVVCAVLATASVVLMAILYEPGTDPSRVYYGTDTRAQSLLIGALLATLLGHRRGIASPSRRRVLHGGAVVAALALAVIWSTTSEDASWQYRGGFALAALLVALVIASVTEPNGSGVLGAVLSVAALRAIGMISYGLYLWHWPIYVYLSEERTALDGNRLLALRLAVTLLVAIASYYVVEQPVRHGALQGWSLRVVVPAGAAALVVALVLATSGAVPPAFREISAATVTPPVGEHAAVAHDVAAGTAAEGATRPPRVMLVGDSVARSLGPGLARASAKEGIEFWDGSVPGCGLATDVGERWFGQWQGLDARCVPGWRERWPSQVEQFDPDVVITLFGAQDAFDRRVDGAELAFDTPPGAALAERDLQAAVTALSSSGAQVVLLTAPYYRLCCPMKIDEPRSPMNEAWITRYNERQLEVARRNPTRARLVDLNQYLGPEGTWTDTVGAVKVRSFDRSHLSEEGADLVASWLVPQLLELARPSHAASSSTHAAASVPTGPSRTLPPIPAFVAART